MDRRRLLIIMLVGVVIVAGVAAVIWLWPNPSEQAQSAEEQAAAEAAAKKAAWFDTDSRLFLFTGNTATTTLYGANTVSQELLTILEPVPTYVSNYLALNQHWYSVTNQVLTVHTSTGDSAVAELTQSPVDADAVGGAASLAVSANEQYVAWVSRTDSIEEVRLYDLTTKTETKLYQGVLGAHYSNLTWSPDNVELAFTQDNSKIITLTADGIELHNSINIPFHEFHSLTWITLNEFGAVASSADTNPEPFVPLIVVLNREGVITEQHDVFDKIGVPKVIWSAAGDQYLFHHPWRNTFMIYDRYDQLVQEVTVAASGKLQPFGYANGNGPKPLNIDIALNDLVTNTDSTTATFTASADDWEKYNTTLRNILGQWRIDLSTYRFTTTDTGLYVAFTYDAGTVQDPAELVFVQTILQAFAVLPDVPSITVLMNDPDGTVLWEATVSADSAASVPTRLLNMSLESLFVINTKHPIGKRATKPGLPDYHYVGDLVYSKFGDYSPYPALALLGATQPNRTFYTTDQFVFTHPTTLQSRALDDQTVVFYSPETIFVSPTSWSTFGLTVKTYDAPGVTMDQWLSVNRPDRIAELPEFTAHAPAEVRHIITDDTFTDEYVVLEDSHAYVFTTQRDAGITPDDQTMLAELVESISWFYAIQRY